MFIAATRMQLNGTDEERRGTKRSAETDRIEDIIKLAKPSGASLSLLDTIKRERAKRKAEEERADNALEQAILNETKARELEIAKIKAEAYVEADKNQLPPAQLNTIEFTVFWRQRR